MTLAAQDVRWRAGGRPVVDGVTLAAEPGRLLGLLGPNGSGKSSLLRVLAGVRRVASGVVTLDGQALGTLGQGALARRLATVDQQAATEAPVTVLDVVRLGRTPHLGALSAWRREDDAAVEAALHQLDLHDRRRQPWHTLSGGERQRTQIARALAQCPSVLLLDEPTNHLDVRHQLDLMTLVAGLPATVVIALHDLNLAAMFCDSLVLMNEGRLVASGPTEAVLTPERIAAVFGVQAHVARSPRHGRLQVELSLPDVTSGVV